MRPLLEKGWSYIAVWGVGQGVWQGWTANGL